RSRYMLRGRPPYLKGVSNSKQQELNASDYVDHSPNDDDESTRAFLRSFHDDEKLAPLLGAVLPHLLLKETRWSEALDGKARASLLKSLLVRLTNKWIKSGRRIAFIFDDAQWLDISSLDVLYDMAEHCPNILILICTRPLNTTSPEALRQIAASKRCQKTVLMGFSKQESSDLLNLRIVFNMQLTKLKVHGVLNIDNTLLEAIYSRTRGSPLFTDFVSLSLIDNIGKALTVTSGGLIQTISSNEDIDSMLISDVSAGIRSQFDKLDADFQSFLRIASVFGQ
ncbi:hypothetical protein HDU67_003528, partial [Dinochytrium kinnereticum]